MSGLISSEKVFRAASEKNVPREIASRDPTRRRKRETAHNNVWHDDKSGKLNLLQAHTEHVPHHAGERRLPESVPHEFTHHEFQFTKVSRETTGAALLRTRSPTRRSTARVADPEMKPPA